MKNKRKGLLVVILLLLVVYLINDLMHFISERIENSHPAYLEASYESYEISYLKWGLSVFGLIGIFLLLLDIQMIPSISILLFVSLQIILIFALKGKLTDLMIGSDAFNYSLLEIAALLMIVVVWQQGKHVFIHKKTYLIIIALSIFFYCAAINPLPVFIPF